MDDEKLQRTIEFILNNQAQFSADSQKLQESNIESDKRMSRIEKAFVGAFAILTETGETLKKTAVAQEQLTVDIKELREAQKETDERLNAVILMVEKYLSRNDNKN